MIRIDAHWDTALFLREYDSLENVPEAHCDWQRFRKYIDIAFMALFIHPLEYRGDAQYREFTSLARALTADISATPDIRLLLKSPQLIPDDPGKLVLLGAEGGGFLGDTAALARLEEAFMLGLRFLGPTWNYSNALAGACNEGGGLSKLGKQVVKRCNELGILLDGAHLSAESLNGLLSLSAAPLTVSHTACAALNQVWKVRNLQDSQLKAVAQADGVIGICFVPAFLGNTPSLKRVVEHIAYAAELIGVEHVGLGSDLDGTELPPDIAGLQSLELLWQEMAYAGFSEGEIKQIAGGNFRRLLQQVLPAK
ncbi:MAG: membrane dipeptidase [Firmicutes bacterium]|nr:membrane dipeptidase [Bacillota bacterium]